MAWYHSSHELIGEGAHAAALTCNTHGGAAKSHDWAVAQEAALFRSLGNTVLTQTRVTGVGPNRKQRGDIELVAYLPHPLTDKRTLAMDLTFQHERYGSSKKEPNGTLSVRNLKNRDRPIEKAARDKIKKHRDLFNLLQGDIGFLPLVASDTGGGRYWGSTCREFIIQRSRLLAAFKTRLGLILALYVYPFGPCFLLFTVRNTSIGPRHPAADWSEVTLEPSLGLLLLQPSIEGDKRLCKASIDAQPLGHAASTLAQSIGMDQDQVLTWVPKLSLLVPPSLSFSLFLSFSSSPSSDRRL